MTTTKRKAEAEEATPPPERSPLLSARSPLLGALIPHAYALIPHPGRPGRFYAVHLGNVTADTLTHLEPSDRSEAATLGMQRIERAMQKRHKEKQWEK